MIFLYNYRQIRSNNPLIKTFNMTAENWKEFRKFYGYFQPNSKDNFNIKFFYNLQNKKYPNSSLSTLKQMNSLVKNTLNKITPLKKGFKKVENKTQEKIYISPKEHSKVIGEIKKLLLNVSTLQKIQPLFFTTFQTSFSKNYPGLILKDEYAVISEKFSTISVTNNFYTMIDDWIKFWIDQQDFMRIWPPLLERFTGLGNRNFWDSAENNQPKFDWKLEIEKFIKKHC